MEEQSQGRYSTFEIRTRAIEAVGRGLTVGEVANAYGIDRSTLFRWLTRFGEHGQAGLQRKEGRGPPRPLGFWEKMPLGRFFSNPPRVLDMRRTCGQSAACTESLRKNIERKSRRTRFGDDCEMR